MYSNNFSKTHTTRHYLPALPQILPFDFGEEAVNSGDTASLTCTVHRGDMPIDITWRHNNKTITNQNGVSVLNGKKASMLNIDAVSPENAGEYSCVANNSAGSTSYSATLNVNGTFWFCSFSLFGS